MLDNLPLNCKQVLKYILPRRTSRKVDAMSEHLLDVLKGCTTAANDSTYLA